jgi:hypothetical protein
LQGRPVTFTAHVAGAGTPTGSVEFVDGTTQLGTAKLSNGTATLTLPHLAAGHHQVTASYNGDADNAPSKSSPLTLTVTSTSTTTLTATPNPGLQGRPVTITPNVPRPPHHPRTHGGVHVEVSQSTTSSQHGQPPHRRHQRH